MDDKVEIFYKILIALSAGVFGIAIAITAQHIKLIGVPKKIIILGIVVQMILSLGVFLGTMIVFRSALLPEMIPNDDWSALTIAYILSSIPHIAVATGITIYNKEINKWLKDRYGDDTQLPNMERTIIKDDVEEAYNKNVKVEDFAPIETKEPTETKDKVCSTCGHKLVESDTEKDS